MVAKKTEMNGKIWHKPLHKRKIWRKMPLINKLLYYAEPFASGILTIWFQPLPFPTLFKLVWSFLLIILITIPFIYPILIMAMYYGIIQYLIESTLDIKYNKSLDLIHNLHYVWNYEITNERHALFIHLYLDRWRYVGALVTSFIDYARLIYTIGST